MSKRKPFTTVAVLFLLIGFPALSYVYLKMGYDYRKEAISVQGDYGKMPDLSGLADVRGQLPPILRGSMVVVGWLDEDRPEVAETYGHMLDSLNRQFDDSPNLHFTTIVNSTMDTGEIHAFADRYHLPDSDHLSFLRTDAATLARTARDFHLPLSEYDSPGSRPIVALVDSSQTIVKYYDLDRQDERIGLVQLISLIIPLPKKGDAVYQTPREF